MIFKLGEPLFHSITQNEILLIHVINSSKIDEVKHSKAV
jgi:hypothetical protein